MWQTSTDISGIVNMFVQCPKPFPICISNTLYPWYKQKLKVKITNEMIEGTLYLGCYFLNA